MSVFNIILTKGLIILLIISLAGLSTIYGYQSLITYGLMPFMLLYILYHNNFKSFAFYDFYSITFLVIILWSFLLFIFLPLDISTASTTLIRMSGVYICVLITAEIMSFKKFDFTVIFLKSFIISFYIIASFLLFGSGGDIDISSGDYIYRGNFDLNANTYSYFSFFANMALFYLIEIKKKNIYIYFSLITTALGIYLSFITSSRSGLLFTVTIPLVYWLFIYKNYRMNYFLKILLVSVTIFYASIKLYNFYDQSYLKQRVEQSVETGESRVDLIQDALNIFAENAFTGIGPGQYALHSYHIGSFSHNSFSEAAANLGIIGLILLILLFITPMIVSIKMYLNVRYKAYRNLIKLNILFFSFFVLYNNFYVFYLTTFGMIFFMIIIHIQKYIKYDVREI